MLLKTLLDPFLATIFNIQNSVEDLAKRVIVTPANAHTLETNRKIIELLPGEFEIYYSADSVVSEDPSVH